MAGSRGAASEKSDTSHFKENSIIDGQNSRVLRFDANKSVGTKNKSQREDRSLKSADSKASERIGSAVKLAKDLGYALFVLFIQSIKRVLNIAHVTPLIKKVFNPTHITSLIKKVFKPSHITSLIKKVFNPTHIISLIKKVFNPTHITLLAKKASYCAAVVIRGIKKTVQVWQAVCAIVEYFRKALMLVSAVALIITVCAVYTVNTSIAYEYMYNGKVLGTVRDKSVVLSTVGLVGDRLSNAYGAQISIDPETDISFNKIFINNEDIDGADDVLRQLTYMKDMKVTGYVLVADGNELATFDSRDTAERLLDMVQQEFIDNTDENKEYTDIGFSENISIKVIDTKLANLQKPESILERVLTGDVVQRYHTVEKGETLSGIAKQNGIKTQEILDMNPEIVPERLMIGQEVKLDMLEPLLTVQTKEVATYIETVPFEIVYEDTSAMYKGEQTVKKAGTKGERQVTAEIIRRNGLESDRVELSSSILTAPTEQVVLVGSKDLPPLIGKGFFKYPTRGGKLTSRFGKRGSRMHYGIDLACPYGTNVYAADGGKVIKAGWNGALGNTIIIDHGGNRRTLYGHCSKIVVKVGDKVAQGQHIGNVGNSGRSTGPHVHFEVHINGVPKNPLNYL